MTNEASLESNRPRTREEDMYSSLVVNGARNIGARIPPSGAGLASNFASQDFQLKRAIPPPPPGIVGSNPFTICYLREALLSTSRDGFLAPLTLGHYGSR